jgi:hypothetical protein
MQLMAEVNDGKTTAPVNRHALNLAQITHNKID